MAGAAGSSTPSEPTFLAGGGEMGALIRAFDWSKTPIGPIETWSPALRMTVSFMLANRFPHAAVVGAAIRCRSTTTRTAQCSATSTPGVRPAGKRVLEGDLARPRAAHRHALPRRSGDLEGGHRAGNQPPRLRRGDALHSPTVRSPTRPRRAASAAYWPRCTRSPRRSSANGDAWPCATWEPFRRGEDRGSGLCRRGETLAAHDKDISLCLALPHDADGKQARLAGAAGVNPGTGDQPAMSSTSVRTTGGWPLSADEANRRPASSPISPPCSPRSPPGPWSDPPRCGRRAADAARNKPHDLAGFLVAGVSRRFRSMTPTGASWSSSPAQIATAVANARAYEEERQRAEALAEIDRAKTAFFSQRQPRVPHAAHPDAGPARRCCWPHRVECCRSSASRLRVVHRNGLRLLKLVNTLLDFSRIEAGRVQAIYEPTDLAGAHRRARQRLPLGHGAGRPATSSSIARRLAEPVYVDRDMWEKIVLNLLSNAFKFTFEGEIEVRAAASGDERPRCCRPRHRHRHSRGRAPAPLRALPPRRGRARPHP